MAGGNNPKRVSNPRDVSRKGGAPKSPTTSIVNGPSNQAKNLQPFTGKK